MNRDLVLIPVLVQVLLTLATYVFLIKAKIRSLRANDVDRARLPLHDDAWPESVMKINNNIRNQFEVPVLFYVLAFGLWALDAVGVIALVAAWLFVLSRIVHAWIHIGTNFVPNRRRAFTVGWWVVLALTLLTAWELGCRVVLS